MTWPLSGQSTILTGDETLPVWREGVEVPENVVYVDGKPIKRNGFSFEITCNVQPLAGRDLLIVPELDRFKEQWIVFMNQEQRPLLVNDRVIRNGINYQVQTTENWGSYTKARIMRIDTGPNQTPGE